MSRNLTQMRRDWQLYLFCLPAVVYIALFAYKPMYGILIAFKNFKIRRGVWGSPWVGFENFERLFSSYWFPVALQNTLIISALSIFIGFPAAIILALIFNEMKNEKFRKAAQTISYAPHFISTVIVCSMVTMFLSPSNGFINKIIQFFGGEAIAFMSLPGWFKWINELSGIWQGVGWSSILYFSALSGVDGALLDAADVDGATRLQKIRYVHIPTIMPTIVITLIMRCGSILSVGYEKILLLQTTGNLPSSEILSTYVYRVGMIQADYSFSTAANLFNTVVNVVMLYLANKIATKTTESGLF